MAGPMASYLLAAALLPERVHVHLAVLHYLHARHSLRLDYSLAITRCDSGRGAPGEIFTRLSHRHGRTPRTQAQQVANLWT